MQLEVGKTYINKHGNEVFISGCFGSEDYPYIDASGYSYRANGRYYRHQDSLKDLTAEKESTTNPKDLIGVAKPSLSAIPASALVHQALAHINGHEKYGFYNWRNNKVQALIYIDAALRHINCYLDGEDYAKDSGVHHLGHVAACCNILLDATETGNLIDNRPPKGTATDVLERFTKC